MADEYLIYEDMLFEADALIKDNHISEAVHLLEDIISRAPDFGKAYNHLGFIYETKLKELEKAEKMYRQCIAYSPDYPAVYINLSIVLSSMGKFDEQKDLLEKSLHIAGVDKASIRNEMGIMYELQEDYNKAIENYKMAIKCTLLDNNLEIYKKSIERCRTKRDLMEL
ncbi:MAG: tetratricopeptide repeat protein [Flavobacteriales bacterium]